MVPSPLFGPVANVTVTTLDDDAGIEMGEVAEQDDTGEVTVQAMVYVSANAAVL